MYSTDGHQLVVNEYFAECLRKAKEQEAQRDNPIAPAHDDDPASARPPAQSAPSARMP